MAKHIVIYPDCPVCGYEMTERSREYDNGSVGIWWTCHRCGSNSPSCINRDNALRIAMEWSRKE